jgi:hypothetical protein
MSHQIGRNQRVRTSTTNKEKRFSYDQSLKNIHADMICNYCHAIYSEKHWRPFADLKPEHLNKLKKGVCPTCHQKKSHVSDGVLHVSGSFLANHSKEIMSIILNAEERETKRNILNRIERINQSAKELTVYTAKNQMAAEIGKKLDSAYKGGKLTIKWSKEDKKADITWKKDSIN